MALDSSDKEEGYLDGVEPDQAQEAPDTPETSEDQGANSPDSPDRDEKKDESPTSMLEAIQKRMAEDSAEDGESSAPAEKVEKDGEADKKAEGEPEANKAKSAEEDQPPFHEHPRWQKVQKELKDAKPKAEQFDRLRNQMTEKGLASEDIDLGIELARIIKHEPAKAVEALKPLLQSLSENIGETLPEDLAQAVDRGEITEDLARSFAKQRGEAEQIKVTQQRASREGAVQAHESARQTADSLWNDWKATDPDAKHLEKDVIQGFELRLLREHRKGTPMSSQLATKLFNETLVEARAERRKTAPRKPAADPKNPDPAATPGQAKPGSMLEAIKQGAAGTYVPA